MANDSDIMNQLSYDTSEINQSIKELSNNVTNITRLISRMKNDLKELNRKHDDLNLILKINHTNSIEYIKFLISNTKDLADTMTLGMQFNASSEVELNAPKSAYDPTINNKIELTFKINASNGFLFFIGNSKNTDLGFMSLEVYNSRVVFNYKLQPTGPTHSLINSKEIKKEETYQVVAER